MAEEGREGKLQAESKWLRDGEFDLVVSDVVPLACAAASLAKIPAVCVSNFSWGTNPSQSSTAGFAFFSPQARQLCYR